MRVLLLSGIDSPELLSISEDLPKLLPGSTIDRVDRVAGAAERISIEGRHPDLLVVVQHAPDEFPRADVAELFRLAPLARWICCYGPWCESDGRNRDLWPPGSRVPFHGFRARLHREVAVLRGERAPLPLTASRDEIFEFDASPFPKKVTGSPPFRIESSDHEWARWMHDLVAGTESTNLAAKEHSPSGDDVLLLDLDPALAGDALRARRKSTSRPRVIGLLGMPCPEDGELLRPAGIDQVVCKLAPLDELIAAVLHGPVAPAATSEC